VHQKRAVESNYLASCRDKVFAWITRRRNLTIDRYGTTMLKHKLLVPLFSLPYREMARRNTSFLDGLVKNQIFDKEALQYSRIVT